MSSLLGVKYANFDDVMKKKVNGLRYSRSFYNLYFVESSVEHADRIIDKESVCHRLL